MYESILAFLINSIGTLGYAGIFILMFLESSFFPFPSEIIMIPAGYLAYTGKMNILLVIAIGVLGSLSGAWLNYFLAHRFGRKLLLKFIPASQLKKVEEFFAQHGHISTFNGRLIPVVRQYISFPAGLAKMAPFKFSLYTIFGAGLWVTVLTYLGYALGQNQKLIQQYLREITILTLGVVLFITLIYLFFKKIELLKNMPKKIFNKYLVISLSIFFIFLVAIKLHAVLTFPQLSDWNYHQLQKINHRSPNFSFAVFGDNKNSVKTFNNLIVKLNQENISFAIDDGDLVYDGEKEKFKFFINQIKKINQPLLTVFGNHEAREEGRAIYYEVFGNFYYSFHVAGAYFIILDDSNEKNLDLSQLAWLKKELKDSQDYQQRFVFMHVPLYDPRKSLDNQPGHSLSDLNFAKKLNQLFDDNQVTMLFASHIHGYYHGRWGKTPYIITGGAGAELAGSDPAHYFYHYIKVSLNQGKVSYQVIKLPSPEFELIDRLTHDAWIYIYAFFVIHFIDILLFIIVIYLAIYLIFIKKEWLILNLKK